jgi:CubicO group peptidase (beta-lactamase class C family)
MLDTWDIVQERDTSRFATGHNPRFVPVPHWDLGAFAPAGGLRSTPMDMSRLATALKMPADTGVTAALILAGTGYRAIGSGADSVGLGWHIMHRDDARIVWHNGGTGGFRTWVGADRGVDRGAVVLANAVQPWVDALGVAVVLQDSLPEPPPVEPVQAVTVTAAQLAPLVGRYALSPAFVMEITHEGGTLYLQATNQPRIRMVATSPVDFAATVVDASITFERDAAGDVVALVLHQGGIDQRAPRQP